MTSHHARIRTSGARAFLWLLAATVACSTDRGSAGTYGGLGPAADGSADGGDGGADDGDGGVRLDVAPGTGGPGDEHGDCDEQPTPNATLRGTVYAPNLEIPISGALVYVTDEDPDPIPDGVYCAECVEFDCESQFTLTRPDGSFDLPTVAGNDRKLVVQKGQFLHITDMDIPAGDTVVPADESNLPGEWNPAAGHYIPRMAVLESSELMDFIYNVLAKIGLGEVDGNGTLIPGTEQFDIYGSDLGHENGNGHKLFEEPGLIDDYHIVFIPCEGHVGIGPPTMPGRIDTIQSWVERGGKWYVTDWANEYLSTPFPSYHTMYEEGGDADLGDYDTVGTVIDPDLLAWLEALPAALKDIGGGFPDLLSLPDVELIDNWSGIVKANDVIVQNDEGEDVNVGPHPWVEGPCSRCYPDAELSRPMTTTSQYGCGRMMFSTYHTSEDAPFGHKGLMPQELILLYIILEIGVCFDEPPPPPPPEG